jgi:hypothetical protein
MGNPVVRKTKEYRRIMILKCLSLTYLDARPVQPIDRACIAAWATGGLDAERRERERWIREEQQRQMASIIRLVRRRDEKLAQRGILSMEDQIQAEEEENRRLQALMEANTKSEESESHDATDETGPPDLEEVEKTKGQLFAEKLKQSFAELSEDVPCTTSDIVVGTTVDLDSKNSNTNMDKLNQEGKEHDSAGITAENDIMKLGFAELEELPKIGLAISAFDVNTSEETRSLLETENANYAPSNSEEIVLNSNCSILNHSAHKNMSANEALILNTSDNGFNTEKSNSQEKSPETAITDKTCLDLEAKIPNFSKPSFDKDSFDDDISSEYQADTLEKQSSPTVEKLCNETKITFSNQTCETSQVFNTPEDADKENQCCPVTEDYIKSGSGNKINKTLESAIPLLPQLSMTSYSSMQTLPTGIVSDPENVNIGYPPNECRLPQQRNGSSNDQRHVSSDPLASVHSKRDEEDIITSKEISYEENTQTTFLNEKSSEKASSQELSNSSSLSDTDLNKVLQTEQSLPDTQVMKDEKMMRREENSLFRENLAKRNKPKFSVFNNGSIDMCSLAYEEKDVFNVIDRNGNSQDYKDKDAFDESSLDNYYLEDTQGLPEKNGDEESEGITNLSLLPRNSWFHNEFSLFDKAEGEVKDIQPLSVSEAWERAKETKYAPTAEEMNRLLPAKEETKTKLFFNVRPSYNIGEILQNYDFEDARTHELFGFKSRPQQGCFFANSPRNIAVPFKPTFAAAAVETESSDLKGSRFRSTGCSTSDLEGGYSNQMSSNYRFAPSPPSTPEIKSGPRPSPLPPIQSTRSELGSSSESETSLGDMAPLAEISKTSATGVQEQQVTLSAEDIWIREALIGQVYIIPKVLFKFMYI